MQTLPPSRRSFFNSFPVKLKPGLLRRDLCVSTSEGAAYSLMVGAGETYFAAFVLAIGLGQVTAGLISSVPLLAGAILQLVSPTAVRWLGSHRRWVVWCAHAQAFSLLALVLAAMTGVLPTATAFLIAAVYWGAGMAAGSAWNTWIGTIVPSRIRARYFARRSRSMQLCLLLGFLGAGAFLQEHERLHSTLGAFAVLFGVAALCRLVSAQLLARLSEPLPVPKDQRIVPLQELILRMKDGPDGRLLFYMLAVQVAVQVAAPFFAPFMLQQLGLSYLEFTVLVATALAARILSLPLLGKLANHLSAGRLLLFSGILMCPMAGAWAFAYERFWALICLQIASGVVWGAYELATTLMIFERIVPEERTSILTTYNFANALASVVGSLVGASILGALSESFYGFLCIFILSSVFRAVTVVFLVKAFKVRPIAMPLQRQGKAEEIQRAG